MTPGASLGYLALSSLQRQGKTVCSEDRLRSQASDEELMAEVQQGDNEAFAQLYYRYVRIVRSSSIRILRNSNEADDLLQEIFLYLYRNCSAWTASKGTVRTWIMQIAHHRALDRHRYLQTRRFYSHDEINEQVESIPDPKVRHTRYECSLEGSLGRTGAQVLFESLSEDQREVIRLAFYEGYNFEEIARMRGQSFGNVRNHYYRGLEKLRKQVFSGKLKGK
jgi:RNA polymerase sigma-70 factor (ECF subfamily)